MKDYSSKNIYLCVKCRTPEPYTDKNNKMRSIFIEIGEELASRIDSPPPPRHSKHSVNHPILFKRFIPYYIPVVFGGGMRLVFALTKKMLKIMC